MTDPVEPQTADKTDVAHLTFAPVAVEDVTAFAAVRINAQTARVYFNQSAKTDPFGATAQHGDPNTGVQRVVQLKGNAGLFVDIDVPEKLNSISVSYNSNQFDLPLIAPTPAYLTGHDCLLTTLNQALSIPTDADDPALNPTSDLRYIRQWLTHHVRYQGVTAALFLNRLGPNDTGNRFANKLRKSLAKNPIPRLEQIVVLDIPVPTGSVDAGDERHLLYAPEAPGKNRMEQPVADNWRAPFGDEILLEYLRQTFFAQANGVSYLDLFDWLSPPAMDQETVFETARKTGPDGYLTLRGERAFPWKLKNDGTSSVGDHICRPFDLDASFSRWVVSPGLGIDQPQVWRPHRILGLNPQQAPDQKLWRFTALRHPGAAPAQLAPKSSLREDAELLNLSTNVLGHDPFRVPEPDITPKTAGRPAAQRGNKIVLVTAMKNEGPFLLEWIAYNRAIGVSDIIVFTNDCTDGTDTFLDVLAARGIVEHYANPYREMDLRPQHAGFRAAEGLPTVQNADWLMTLDVDEFMNIHVGDGHLNDLFAKVGDANMISCTWRLFGNGDISGFEDDLLTRQFTSCAAETASRPHQAWGFKTLYQNNGFFKKLGVHRPKGLRGQAVEQINWVNGAGQTMPEKEFRTGWRSNTQTIGYDLVTLNHYAVRSTESFLVKRDRGRVNHVDRDQGSAYWFRMNHNTTEDKSIQRMIPQLEIELNTLLADPEIRNAHAFCVSQHRAKVAELVGTPEQRALHDTLNSARFKTLSRMLPAFGSNVFLAGPDCIPQGLVDQYEANMLPANYSFTVERPEDTQH